MEGEEGVEWKGRDRGREEEGKGDKRGVERERGKKRRGEGVEWKGRERGRGEEERKGAKRGVERERERGGVEGEIKRESRRGRKGRYEMWDVQGR